VANEINDDFVEFCRNATDRQLENILKKEYEAWQHRDYPSARIAAAERGWRVQDGVRLE
jgi:hypothetical protein